MFSNQTDPALKLFFLLLRNTIERTKVSWGKFCDLWDRYHCSVPWPRWDFIPSHGCKHLHPAVPGYRQDQLTAAPSTDTLGNTRCLFYLLGFFFCWLSFKTVAVNWLLIYQVPQL